MASNLLDQRAVGGDGELFVVKVADLAEPLDVVNVVDLNEFHKGNVVDPQKLKEANLIKSTHKPLKILGKGEIKKPLTVRAHSFSKNAIEKIKKAGGTVEYV